MMKQRFTVADEYPVVIRTRGTARNRGFDKPCDAKKIKRVRFDDTETDTIREGKLAQSPRSDGPKTSEYAYFMNIKNATVHGHSCSYDRGNVQLKNSKPNRHGREDIKTSKIPKPSSNNLRFYDCRETTGHFVHHLLLTPPVTKYGEPSQGDIKDLTRNIREKPLLLSENVTPVDRNSSSSILRKGSENASLSGNQCKGKDIFSAKRQRLRQWALNSISEVEKPHPEGIALISSLLSRLYHKCGESDLFYVLDSSKGEIGNGCKAPISCEFDNLEERRHISHRRKWNTEPPKICLGGYKDRVFLEHDAYFSGSPLTNYGTEARFKDEMTDLHISSMDHKSRSSHVDHDLPFCLPSERYGYSSSCYLEELDVSCSPIERQRKEPHRFLLKWDFEREKDGGSSSIINYESANICSPGLYTWNVNHQQIVDHIPDAKTPCSQSLISGYYLQYNSIQSYPLTSDFAPDFLPNFDGAKCSALRTDMSSLTFSGTPKCIALTEDTNAETIPYGSNQLCFKNKAWDSKPPSDFWRKGFKDADFCLKNPSIFRTWQFPQMDDSSCSLDSTVNCLLLLDDVTNDCSDREVYFDDDNKWNCMVDVVPYTNVSESL